MSDDPKLPTKAGLKRAQEALRSKLRVVSQKDVPVPETGCSGCPKARNFWNTCPLKLDYLPDTPCSVGEQSIKTPDSQKPPCEWAINSKEHNYCFWRWVQSQSASDGQMPEHMQGEMSELLGMSSTKVHSTLKDAFKKLKKNKGLTVLLEILRAKQAGESGTNSQIDEVLTKALNPEGSDE